MTVLFCIYLVLGIAWAIYAGRMQFKSGLSSRMDLQFWLCISLNLVLWPLGVISAWMARR